MKKRLLAFVLCVLLAATALPLTAAAETAVLFASSGGSSHFLDINAANFPDESLRSYIIREHHAKWDSKTRSYYMTEEQVKAATVFDIKLSFFIPLHLGPITDFKGIEHFTELRVLSCYTDGLTKVSLKNLDLRNNTKLEELSVREYLLSSLDLTRNTALKKISIFGDWLELESLELGRKPNLTYLELRHHQFNGWASITRLDASQCPALETLLCERLMLNWVDLSKCTALKDVTLNDCRLSKLDLTGSKKIEKLVCCDNVITDFNPANDQISLSGGDMENLSGITATNNGMRLDFGSGSVELRGFDTSAATTIDGTAYTFGDGAILNPDRTAATVLAGAAIDLSDTLYADVTNVNALGASVKAGATPVTLSGSDATLAGGDGADLFLFTGGNITIQNYQAADQISLPTGYELGNSAFNPTTSKVTLNVGDAQIVLDTIGNGTDVTIWQNGISTSQKYGQWAEFSSPTKPQNSMKVTLLGSYGDFGVQGDSLDSGYSTTGADAKEYYGSMLTIQASQADSTVVGNQLGNTIYVVAGDRNVLTGGIGKDYFIFQDNSGGVVTDFGIGSTKDETGFVRATSATLPAYDRNDPRTYAAGIDTLQVYGTVTAVAIDGDDHADNELMTAYVTYRGKDKQSHYIALTNIAKKPLTATPYQTNKAAAQIIKIWDISASTNPALISSSDLKNLLVFNVDDVPETLLTFAAQYYGTNGVK